METGKIRYSLMTREDGGVLDDVLVYHLEAPGGKPFCFMVVNASNREKILGWLQQNGDPDKFGFEDRTTSTAMIAVQGPGALAATDSLCAVAPSTLKYYHGMMTEVCGAAAIVSRTGYTGEDGCELTVPAEKAEEIWSTILANSSASGARAVGLAARDTLRLEAAMPLYGHELTEETNPAKADVDFAINLKDRQFPGRDAIAAARQNAALPRRIGLEMDGKRAAREHSLIYVCDQQVGEVTSGTFSPTLQKPIAMAYIDPGHASTGTELEIDVRGKRLAARVCGLPFYKRS
jgi:aminomethyltransferase